MGKIEKKGEKVKKEVKSKKKNRKITIDFEGCEIIERQASKFGTGAHVIIPKEYAGKKVKIIMEEK